MSLTKRSSGAPAGVALVLSWLLDRGRRECVLGDLEEELADLERSGASRWRRTAYAWREVARTAAARLDEVTLGALEEAAIERRLRASAHGREVSMIAALRHDLLQATRALRGAPVSTAFAALVLALGLGGTAATWSVLESMVLEPLRFEDSERLIGFWQDGSWSLEEVEFARERLPSIETLAAFDPYVEASLEGPDGAVLVPAASVTCDYFAALRSPAFLGRTPTAEDCVPGAAPTVVLAHETWLARFGGDRGIVGSTLRIGSRPTAVIGVMAPELADFSGRFAFWLPVANDPADPDWRNNHSFSLLGRLADDADLTVTQREVERLAADLGESFQYPPDFDKAKGAFAVALRRQVTGRLAPPLRALLVAAGCVLLIACANVANLQLVRSLRRRGELLVRAALGASRWHLVRQLLAESALLVTASTVAAVLLARGALAAVPWLLPPGTARVDEVRLTPGAIALLLLVAVVTTVVLALAPAARTRLLAAPVGRPGQDRAEPRLRSAFVVVQTSLAVVLLFGAASALRHFETLLEIDTGYDASDVTLARIELPADAIESTRAAMVARVEQRLASLPGVATVGAVQRPPLVDGWVMPLEREDRPVDRNQVAPTAFWRAVTPGYFAATDLALLRGRLLEARDDGAAPPVALVNEELARRFFPGEDPLGRTVRVPLHDHYSTIVGIVRNERLLGPGVEPPAILYQPYAQAPVTRSLTFAVETADAPAALGIAAAARAALADIDPRIAVAEIEPLREAIARRLQPLRSLTTLLSALALLGVALGALGLFGVLSTSVLRRTREIAVRVAVGASAAQVLRLVVRQSLALTAIGLGAGLALALALLRLLGASLGGFRPGPLEALVSVGALAVAAAVASLWPALRAARVDPTAALRSE